MSVQVPFKSDDDIEDEARHLLATYSQSKGPIETPPVPIEGLIRYLGLRYDVLDLYGHLGIRRDEESDLLGALFIETRWICVHDGLDPDVHPWLEGRFNFTLGHEVGHWVLHRSYISGAPGQLSLLDEQPKPSMICRRSASTDRIEVQSNKFARSLLLPRSLVTKAWRVRIGIGQVPRPEQINHAVRAVAKEFQMSIVATRYRVEALGLLDGHRRPDLRV